MMDFGALRGRFPLLAERTYLATQCLGPCPEDMLADLDEYRHTLHLRSRGLPLWFERIDEMMRLAERLLHAPADGFPIERLVEQIDERTAVVALSLVSPWTAALAALAPVIDAAHRAGAMVVVDAYQALGVVPIDVQALGVDVLVGGTHKWLCGGGTGLVFLYVRPDLAERLEPGYPGWIGPALEPIYTARAGLRFVLEVGVDACNTEAECDRAVDAIARELGR